MIPSLVMMRNVSIGAPRFHGWNVFSLVGIRREILLFDDSFAKKISRDLVVKTSFQVTSQKKDA